MWVARNVDRVYRMAYGRGPELDSTVDVQRLHELAHLDANVDLIPIF